MSVFGLSAVRYIVFSPESELNIARPGFPLCYSAIRAILKDNSAGVSFLILSFCIAVTSMLRQVNLALFEIIETRDSCKPTVIISQLPVLKWWDLFKDNTYADACLSRMTKKALRLECNGRDMRSST